MTSTTTTDLLAELTSTAAAVRGNDWLAGGLGRSAGLGMLGSTASPLSALSGAGLGWFTSYVSFLEEPFDKLRGNPGSVSTGSQDFQDAGQNVSSLAQSYRDSTSKQTSSWTGDSASSYRDAGSQHADGIAALGQASSTVASAIAGAGEVVAQAVEAITQLVTEAVGKIIPIMTQAVAAAPATFGQSIVAAIPQCVQIAVDCGQKILAKLAALLASGQNLLKLVQGALAVVEVVKKVLSQISQQANTKGATKGEAKKPTKATDPQSSTETSSPNMTGSQNRTDSPNQSQQANTSTEKQTAATGSPVPSTGAMPMSTAGVPSGSTPSRTTNPALNPNLLSSGLPTADPTGFSSYVKPAAAPTSSMGGSGVPMGLAGVGFGGVQSSGAAEGARRTLGVGDVVGEAGKEMTAGRAPAAKAGMMAGPGMLGGAPGAHGQGGEDKEHRRKYPLGMQDEDLFGENDESVVIAPEVIGEEW